MLRLLFCFALSVQVALGVGTGTYICKADKTLDYIYTWDDSAGTCISGGDVSGCDPFKRLLLKGSTCEILRTGVEATTTLTLTDLSAAGHTCAGGFTYAGTVASGIVFYITKDETVVQLDDLGTPAISCDSANPTTTQTLDPAAVTASGDPTGTGTATVVQETVVMSMVDAAAIATTKPTCALGDNMKILLTLTTSATADGVHAVTCRARNQAAATGAGLKTIDLLTTSCSLAGVVTMTGGKGFKKDTTTNSLPTGNNYVFQDTLKCFSFHPSAELHFECDVTFCGATSAYCDGDVNGDSCFNVNVAPGSSGRKRRAITNSTDTNQKTASVTILVGNYPSRTWSTAPSHQECSGLLSQTTFIVIVTILAVLLVLSMGATVYVAKKSRGTSSHPPPYLAKGADNPAF